MKASTLASVVALSLSGVATAGTFHVATTGNDTADGSADKPWRTIQRAANAVAAGDTVQVHPGRYVGFTVERSGTEAKPIAFVADAGVEIDGAGTTNRDAVLVDGAAWIRIEGFTINGAKRAGVAALECHDVTVRANKIDASGTWGVFSGFCDDMVIEDNTTSHSVAQHGIYVSNSGDRPIIRRNKIFGNSMAGIHMNGDISQGGDGMISGAVVEDNVISDNGKAGGSAINCDGVTGAVIRNNMLDGNHASGVSLYSIDGAAPSTNNHVVNNTVRMASDARWAINIQDASTGNTLHNNILLHASPSRGAVDICAACLVGLASDHNAVVGRFSIDGTNVDLSAWRNRTKGDAASFVSSDGELFTDPAHGDLTLKPGAPAIDHGMATGAPEHDVAGAARPQGTAYDIGAYEHCDGPCAGGMGGGDGSGSGGGDGSGDGGGDGGTDGSDPTSGCSTGGSSSAGLALGLLALARRRRR